jgi:hypothetical protein
MTNPAGQALRIRRVSPAQDTPFCLVPGLQVEPVAQTCREKSEGVPLYPCPGMPKM